MNPSCTVEIILQPIFASSHTPNKKEINHWIKTTLNYIHKIKPCIRYPSITVTVRIVDESEIQYLNNTYRKKDKPTNVLSFPSTLPPFLESNLQQQALGDIILCAPVIEREAGQQNKKIHDHFAHMIVHSTLHLLGYDHVIEKEAQQMESYEEAILNQLGFPNPYISFQKESE